MYFNIVLVLPIKFLRENIKNVKEMLIATEYKRKFWIRSWSRSGVEIRNKSGAGAGVGAGAKAGVGGFATLKSVL